MNTNDKEIEVKILSDAEKEVNLGVYPTPDEMTQLNIRRLNGDEKAREEMIVRNDALVVWFVRRKRGSSDPNFDDYLQSGRMGLMKAVDKFDHTMGNFTTYAIGWIWNHITRTKYKEERTIRIPVHVRARINQVRRVAEALEKKLGRRPDLDEISEESGVSIDTIVDDLEKDRETTSLDRPIELNDGDLSLHGLVADNKGDPSDIAIAIDEGHEALRWLFDLKHQLEDEFSPADRRAFCLRWGVFGGNYRRTLQQVGSILGVTRERVRQISTKVFRRRQNAGLHIGSTDEMKSILQCAQTSAELSFASNRYYPPGFVEVFGDKSSGTSTAIGEVKIPNDRVIVKKQKKDGISISTKIVRELRSIVSLFVQDQERVKAVTISLANSDFNIPAGFSGRVLRMRNADLVDLVDEQMVEEIRSKYTLKMLGDDPKIVWKRQGKLFPSQKVEAKVLHAAMEAKLAKARKFLKENTEVPKEIRKAMLVLYGIGVKRNNDLETFRIKAQIYKDDLHEALDRIWLMLVRIHGVEIRSHGEYLLLEEHCSLFEILLK